MSQIFFTGLTSGVDWNEILEKIIEVKSKKLEDIKNKNLIKKEEKNFWANLNVKLLSIINSIDNIKKTGNDIFNTKEIINSNKNIASFNIIDNAYMVKGTYIVEVKAIATNAIVYGNKLYTAEDSFAKPAIVKSSQNINYHGNINSFQKIVDQIDYFDIKPENYGIISINNKQIEWSIEDSLNDILAKINSSIAGVTVHFDEIEQKIVIKSNLEGKNSKIDIKQISGNFLESFKIEAGVYYGQDAVKTDPNKILNENSAIDIQVTNGYFTLNDVKIYVDISRDSINTIIRKINFSNTNVNAYYDQINNRIILEQKNSGEANRIKLGAPGDTSNFLYAMKLSESQPSGTESDIYKGTDAVININGTDFIRSSNKIDDILSGISINLISTGITNIKIDNDINTISSNVKDLMEKINILLEDINVKLNEQIVKDPKTIDESFKGKMRLNSTLQIIKSKIIEVLTQNYNLSENTSKSLEEYGIKIEYYDNFKKIRLNFNEEKFKNILKNNFEETKTFFTASNGIIQNLNKQLNNLVSFNGLINMEMKEIEQTININNLRINEISQRLANERDILKKQFIQLEVAMVKMQSQLTRLLNLQNNR